MRRIQLFVSCQRGHDPQLGVAFICGGQCPRNFKVPVKEVPQSCYQENQVSRFPGFNVPSAHFVATKRETRAVLVHLDRASVLLVKWPSRHLGATLCACNFHYDFRLSSFSIFSFIVFSYNHGCSRRAILRSECADKICRPWQQGGLLSHTSYFSSQKCVWGLT